MRHALAAAAVLFCSCSPVSGRFETLSAAPSFRAKSVAVAAARGARGRGVEIGRALVARLEASGLAASALEESDSVLAGSALGLETARSPRVLDEIRRATGADAVVFVSLDPDWRSLDVSALDARTGDAVLRAAVKPRGPRFSGPPEIADAAARALAALSADRKPRPSKVDDDVDEIPVP